MIYYKVGVSLLQASCRFVDALWGFDVSTCGFVRSCMQICQQLHVDFSEAPSTFYGMLNVLWQGMIRHGTVYVILYDMEVTFWYVIELLHIFRIFSGFFYFFILYQIQNILTMVKGKNIIIFAQSSKLYVPSFNTHKKIRFFTDNIVLKIWLWKILNSCLSSNSNVQTYRLLPALTLSCWGRKYSSR